MHFDMLSLTSNPQYTAAIVLIFFQIPTERDSTRSASENPVNSQQL